MSVIRPPSSDPRPPCGVAAPALRAYFYSGWAFLIPYLLTYLLYAWLKWPANPTPATSGQLSAISGQSSVVHGPSSLVPCLLYVYWALHAINLVLAALALRSWWKDAQRSAITSCPLPPAPSAANTLGFQVSALNSAAATDTPGPSRLAPSSNFSAFSFQLSAFGKAASPALPWALLALIFAIPGVYLEWPADPWEHLRRITEWNTHALVGSHSAGYKSLYFFAYSWVGWLSPVHLLSWLNVYYVSICLLLAWQYYLLAIAVGLDRRWAFMSVIVNVLTFGNSCFSFYRYYGISSSIFAQLGAVALTRIALEYAKSFQLSALSSQLSAFGHKLSLRRFFFWLTVFRSGHRSPVTVSPSTADRKPPTVYRLLFSALCLLLLIGSNHVQGLGIAGLGIAAIIIWRLIEWKRSMIFWLGSVAIILSVAAVLWLPRNPLIDASLRPQGWLNVWYGFDFFSPASPASDRLMQILGLFGLFNLAAGVLLLRRNNVVGWLTLISVIALGLPFAAIPFANRIAAEIIVYHRMFFSVPSGLAVVAVAQQLQGNFQGRSGVRASRRKTNSLRSTHLPLSLSRFPLSARVPWDLLVRGPWSSLMIFILSLAAAVVIAPGRLNFNRVWQILAWVPKDLRMDTVLSTVDAADLGPASSNVKFLAPAPLANVLGSVLPHSISSKERAIAQPITDSLAEVITHLRTHQPTIRFAFPMLIRDPFAADPATWITLAGTPPEFVSDLKDFPGVITALQNKPGQRSSIFTRDLVPITPSENYQVEWSIRLLRGTGAKAYMAVAWYNEKGELLRADEPAPRGAAKPAGWSNGTYSYIGLVGTQVPTGWTTYRSVFGPEQQATIPRRSRFVRIGALLNHEAAPNAVVQLSGVRLSQLSRGHIATTGIFPSNQRLVLVIPSATAQWTFASQAGQASTHWPPQAVTSDFAGAAELSAAARAARGTTVETSQMIFTVPPWGK